MIHVEQINASDLRIHADEGVLHEVWEFFSYKNESAKWIKNAAQRRHASHHRLFRLRTKCLPAGLYRHLLAFAESNKYPIEGWSPIAENISLAEVQRFVEDLKLPHDAYEHQVLGITKALRYKRRVLESSTSSGKSLMIYGITRFLSKQSKRILIIVPTINLAHQLYDDFTQYSAPSGWKVTDAVSLYRDSTQLVNRRVVISLWQTIQDKPAQWFEQFDAVLVDEAHHGEAKVLTKILRHCTNAHYRIGLTGSVKDSKIHRLVLEGNFGPITTLITNQEAIAKNISTDLTIKALVLKYSEKELRDWNAAKWDYPTELHWLLYNEKRNNFISNLALSQKKNTLVMVREIAHGTKMEALLKAKEPGRKVYWVHGGTEAEEREVIRKLCESEQNAVIVASTVFQEGFSLRNLHAIIFASPSKSKIRVLQMIGRGLRKMEGKERCVLFDIVDDCRVDNNTNYTLLHYIERLKLYQREEFPVKTYNIRMH